MWLTLIILADGTEIFSGPGSGPKVQNATIKQMVNDGTELKIGSCCATRFECTLLNPGGELSIAAGEEITVYRVKGDTRQLIGYFTMEEPIRPSANRYQITAYDRISWLDKDLSDWVLSLEEWPYTVEQFAWMVCTECGLTLATDSLLNGDYQIQRFAGSGITGRKLMQWIGEISARFCRATPEGAIEFEWYKQSTGTGEILAETTLSGGFTSLLKYEMFEGQEEVAITCDGKLYLCAVTLGYSEGDGYYFHIGNMALFTGVTGGSNDTGEPFHIWGYKGTNGVLIFDTEGEHTLSVYGYWENVVTPKNAFSISLCDYQTKTIDRVQIQLTQDDIGVIYPDVEGVTYPITGNYLLTATDPQALEVVAENVFRSITEVTYTPGTVIMAHNPDVWVGDILKVTDRNGQTVTMYVMTKTIKGQKDTLECTGSYSRDSSSTVHEESFKAVNAKMLEIRKDITGLAVRATETETRIEDNRAYTDQKIAEVTIQADGIASMVEDVRETVDGVESQISTIQQTAESISLRVEGIVEHGVDKVSTGFGLTVKDSAVVIARDNAPVENRLDETGMYVTRSDGTVVMQAAADGVITQNLNVRGYLDIFGLIRKQAWTDENGNACVATLWTGG